MKKIYYLVLLLTLFQTTVVRAKNEPQKSLIHLKFQHDTLRIVNLYSAAGDTSNKNPAVPTPVDYGLLKFKIDEGEKIDEKKKLIKIFVREKGGQQGALIKDKVTFKTWSEFSLMEMLGLTADNLPKTDMIISINHGGKALLNISIKSASISKPAPSKQEEEKNKNGELCSNPSFYTTSLLSSAMNQKQYRKAPYYVLKHDFSNINNGPSIFLHRFKKVNTKNNTDARVDSQEKGTLASQGQDASNKYQLRILPRKTLKVGRMYTVTFDFYTHRYNKIIYSYNFKDYNHEDQTYFKSIMGPENVEKPKESATKGTSGDSEAYEKVINKLITDLDLFLKDLNYFQPDTKIADLTLLKVKDNIRKCIPDLTAVNSESLRTALLAGPDTPDYQGKVAEAVSLFTSLEWYSSYSPPSIQVENADEVRSLVKYYEKGNTTPVDTQSYKTPIIGGFKLDFSTGFIFSQLQDKQYFIAKADPVLRTRTLSDNTTVTDTIAMNRILLEDGSKTKLNIGILSHFYPRLSKSLSLAFTSGFIIKNASAIQFPIGGSILIGRSPRLVVSAGRVFGERKELSARYTEGEPIEASELSNITAENLTVNRSRDRWFFSFTYNFGGFSIGK